MIQWFGDPWDSSICYDHEHRLRTTERISPPVGARCVACDTPILAGEPGVVTGYLRTDGTSAGGPLHRECFVMSITGPLSHIQRRCGCYGGPRTAEHESDRPCRKEALLVWEYLQRHQNRHTWP